MARISFTDWLLDQSDRQDDVGDLALNYQVDAMQAPRAISVAEVHQRLLELDATPAYLMALEKAAQEYGIQAV